MAASIDPGRVLSLLDEKAAGWVRDYFDENGSRDALFTGRRFESLDGGGDRPAVADVLTAADLVAVSLLSVTIPAAAAIDLLDGHVAGELTELLREIPTSVALADDKSEAHVAPGSPADRAWATLNAIEGIGWVTASKLLARKRPRLIPVYDSVVRCVLGQPAHMWLSLRDALRADEGRVEHRVREIRRDAGVPAHVSSLRVLDVALWMGHRVDHRAGTCHAAPGDRGSDR